MNAKSRPPIQNGRPGVGLVLVPETVRAERARGLQKGHSTDRNTEARQTQSLGRARGGGGRPEVEPPPHRARLPPRPKAVPSRDTGTAGASRQRGGPSAGKGLGLSACGPPRDQRAPGNAQGIGPSRWSLLRFRTNWEISCRCCVARRRLPWLLRSVPPSPPGPADSPELSPNFTKGKPRPWCCR